MIRFNQKQQRKPVVSLKSEYQTLLRCKKEAKFSFNGVSAIAERYRRVTCLGFCSKGAMLYDCSRNCECNSPQLTNSEREEMVELWKGLLFVKLGLRNVEQEVRRCQEKMIIRWNKKRIALRNKKARQRKIHGAWIHIFNETVYNWKDYLNNFSGIRGEICVSRENDYQFSTWTNGIGVKIEGELTAQWTYDCWSIRLATGKRWGTRNGGNHRHEGWLIPANCKITALVCFKITEEIKRIAEEINLPLEVVSNKDSW